MSKGNLRTCFVFTLIFCSILIGSFATLPKVKAQPPGRECSTNLMLTLDTSGSMGGDCNPSQQRAQQFLDAFMADPAWQNYAGVVHFGQPVWTTRLTQGLTDSLAIVRPAVIAGCPGMTPTESGIVMATEELLEEAANPLHAGVPMAMIIVTDGGPNGCASASCYCRTSGPPCDSGDTCSTAACDSPPPGPSAREDAIAAANAARAAGIRVFVIGFGAAAPGNRPFNRSLADDGCPGIAPPGFPPDCLWEAPAPGDLPAIFDEIFLLIADKDGDGFVAEECGGDDEDDSNGNPGATGPCVNPLAPEELDCMNPATGGCPGEGGSNVCSVDYYCETYMCALNCSDDLDNDQDDAPDQYDTDCPAPGGIVPCGRARDDPQTVTDETEPCSLCHIFVLIKRIIDFLVEVVVFPLLILMVLIGGFIFITAAGSESRVRSGKNMITIAVIATIIVLVAWLVINTVLFFLTGQEVGGIATILGQPWNEIDCTVGEIQCVPAPGPNCP